MNEFSSILNCIWHRCREIKGYTNYARNQWFKHMSVIDSLINSEIENEAAISQLQQLIRVPSISAVNQSLPECATLVSKLMNECGINSQLLYLENDKAPSKYSTSCIR